MIKDLGVCAVSGILIAGGIFAIGVGALMLTFRLKYGQ